MSKVPFGVVTRKNISENVIHLRKMHGLTQYNFADLMHIPRSRIARVEAFTRQSGFTMEQINNICEAFGIEEALFVGDHDAFVKRLAL